MLEEQTKPEILISLPATTIGVGIVPILIPMLTRIISLSPTFEKASAQTASFTASR